MQYMVVIGKTQAAGIRAEDMDMRAAAQRPSLIRRRNGEGIKRDGFITQAICHYRSTAMMKIILPLAIRIFRPVDKNIAQRFLRATGHHAHMRTRRCPINYLGFAAFQVYSLNGQPCE